MIYGRAPYIQALNKVEFVPIFKMSTEILVEIEKDDPTKYTDAKSSSDNLIAIDNTVDAVAKTTNDDTKNSIAVGWQG